MPRIHTVDRQFAYAILRRSHSAVREIPPAYVTLVHYDAVIECTGA
jgi:hypothetical protein